jgi:hypothetical protein
MLSPAEMVESIGCSITKRSPPFTTTPICLHARSGSNEHGTSSTDWTLAFTGSPSSPSGSIRSPPPPGQSTTRPISTDKAQTPTAAHIARRISGRTCSSRS